MEETLGICVKNRPFVENINAVKEAMRRKT
jgi:hypothetical protein